MNRQSPARTVLERFLTSEATGGLVLMGCAALALIVANSPLAPTYFDTLKANVLGLSVLHWINDALMAVFFLLVGLEIKRELVVGDLAAWPARALPGIAALGGMIVPALIYIAINASAPEELGGWAIPAATDIAFALGVLALLGSRVPPSLKVFLTALAILDDLGAVVIIALFYGHGFAPLMLGLAAAAFAALIVLNRMGQTNLAIYLGLGALLWFFVLKSGIHPTVAGVLVAMTIPIGKRDGEEHGPLHRLEGALAPWVAFLILPVFGLANAGVALGGLGSGVLTHPVTVGVALGLFLGKQAGVFGGAWIAVRLGLAARPAGAGWRQLYGVAVLCGVGFTMSLFIGLLAFETDAFVDATKIGVLVGSLASAVLGWLILRGGSRGAPEAVGDHGH